MTVPYKPQRITRSKDIVVRQFTLKHVPRTPRHRWGGWIAPGGAFTANRTRAREWAAALADVMDACHE